MNYIMNNNDGYLELIIGPMFAGKSTELLRKINQYKILNKKILIINHIFNSRYNETNETIITHDKNKIDNCLALEKLSDLDINLINYNDVIIIEELQFFNDAYDIIIDMVDNLKKHVICAGLDGDSNKKPFGDVLKLIPHCNNVKKYKALCKKCCNGNYAYFSKKIIKNNNTTLIGGENYYEAVCRKHYLEN